MAGTPGTLGPGEGETGGPQACWALERAPRRAEPEGEGCGCPQKGPQSREGCGPEPQRAGWGWARLVEALGQVLGPPCREQPHPWRSLACPGGHGDPHGRPSPRTATVPGREPPGTWLQGHRAVRGPQPPSRLRATGTQGREAREGQLSLRGDGDVPHTSTSGRVTKCVPPWRVWSGTASRTPGSPWGQWQGQRRCEGAGRLGSSRAHQGSGIKRRLKEKVTKKDTKPLGQGGGEGGLPQRLPTRPSSPCAGGPWA